LVQPVDQKYFMTDAELAQEKKLAHERAAASELSSNDETFHQNQVQWVWLAWAAVGVPLAWGVYRTGLSVGKFFN